MSDLNVLAAQSRPPRLAPSVSNLIDTHCHLDFHVFDEERAAVVDRARQVGVSRILVPAIDLETAHTAIRLSETYGEVYAAVGFHPNDLSRWNEDSLAALEKLAQHPKVVAIGEIGLDYYRQRTAKETQQRVFQEHLALAARLGKPVIIHTRESAEDALEMLKAWRASLPANWRGQHPRASSGAAQENAAGFGVLHSFSGSAEIARQALALGFFLGITGPVTFSNARQQQELVKSLPLERLLIETDAPFLTPHPWRGQRNEPAYVRLVAEKIAELHNVSVQKVAEQTSNNARALFGLS